MRGKFCLKFCFNPSAPGWGADLPRKNEWAKILIIGLIAAHNHNFVVLISHLVTLLWPLSVKALYPPVITIVFPLLSGIPQAPAPLSFKGNESPPEREMPL